MKYQIHPAIEHHLANIGLTETEAVQSYLFPELKDLPAPSLLKSMDAAVQLVIEAMLADDDILIWGDYDVDGITGTALLVMFFRAVGVEVKHHIPDRLTEGYGLNCERLTELSNSMSRKKLLITVDCGISNSEEIIKAQELGFKVIVTDHHQVPGGNLHADATINPKQSDCTFPFDNLAGVGVSFYLAAGIRAGMKINKDSFPESYNINLKSFLDLVSLGTLADMMPLEGANRILAKAGFESIATNDTSLVSVLLKGLRIDPRYLVSENIAFQVAPVINAAGRMGQPGIPFSMLTSHSAQEAEPLVQKMILLNEKRKQVSRHDFEKAKKLVSNVQVEQDKCIVLCADFHEGILGITAARLVEQYRVPALVCCFYPGDRGRIKGSGRSPGNINLYESLAQCSDFLSSFGGHQAAAGFSLLEKNFSDMQEKFKHSILTIWENNKCDSSTLQTKNIDLSLSDALDRLLVNNLMQLEPFGEDNPRPVFRDKMAKIVSVIYFGNQNEHVRGMARGRHQNVPFIGFNLGEKFRSIDSGGAIAMDYTHMLDMYNGKLSWKIRVVNAWPGRQGWV